MAKSSTSFKKGQVANPKGRPEGSQNFARMALLAAKGALTSERITSDLLELEPRDRVNATIKFAEIDLKSQQHDLYMETEPALAKARLDKLNAETAVSKQVLDAVGGKTIDQVGPELLEAIKASEIKMDGIIEEKD